MLWRVSQSTLRGWSNAGTGKRGGCNKGNRGYGLRGKAAAGDVASPEPTPIVIKYRLPWLVKEIMLLITLYDAKR